MTKLQKKTAEIVARKWGVEAPYPSWQVLARHQERKRYPIRWRNRKVPEPYLSWEHIGDFMSETLDRQAREELQMWRFHHD